MQHIYNIFATNLAVCCVCCLDMILQVVPRPQHCQLAYLSGPSFAAEVAAGMPTGLTIAARVSTCMRTVLMQSHAQLESACLTMSPNNSGAHEHVMLLPACRIEGCCSHVWSASCYIQSAMLTQHTQLYLPSLLRRRRVSPSKCSGGCQQQTYAVTAQQT